MTMHVVSLVMNAVEGDSRVIKTAKAAEAAGYKATIVGVGNVTSPTPREIDGANVLLVPNDAIKLKKAGLWGAKDKRRLELLAEAHLRNVCPAVEQLKPSILHSHDMIGLRIGAAISRRIATAGNFLPWVHDLHEYVVGLTTIPDQFRLACMEYERRYLRQADHLITVSERLADEVTRYYHLSAPPTVVFNAPYFREPSNEEPDVRSVLGLPNDVKLVVYIGVAKKERGCETLVDAIAALPGVHICFVSQGAYVEALRAKAVTLGMADRFHSTPYVSSEKVTSFIRSADVGVHGLTHYPNGEVAMPNKLFEYLHAGLPIVVSDVEEMKRFVDKTETGEVFKADNAFSCAYSLSRVLNNRHAYKARITTSLIKEYSWQTQSQKLSKIYHRLASLTAGRSERKLVLYGDQSKIKSREESPTDVVPEGVHVGVVSRVSPTSVVDFYLDPEARGDRAGVLSRVVAKYSKVEVVGRPPWPTESDISVDVIESAPTSAPVTTIADLEQRRLKQDELDIVEHEREIAKSVRPT